MNNKLKAALTVAYCQVSELTSISQLVFDSSKVWVIVKTHCDTGRRFNPYGVQCLIFYNDLEILSIVPSSWIFTFEEESYYLGSCMLERQLEVHTVDSFLNIQEESKIK